MSLKALTARLKARLNKSMPAARDAELGTRLGAYESIGVMEHDYDGAHTDAEYSEDDLPINPIVVIKLSDANASANLILPPDLDKLYIIENVSGQTVTVKAEGESGVAVANNSTEMVISNGEDFVSLAISASAGTEVTLAGTQTLTNKTLTTPVIASIYQDSGKTKLMTLPDTESDTLVTLAAEQTLTNKTLTAPVITSPDMVQKVVTYDFENGDADWELSEDEEKAGVLIATNANGAVRVLATPTEGRFYTVINSSGEKLTILATGKTGVEIENGKAAIVMGDGTDFVRITLDA